MCEDAEGSGDYQITHEDEFGTGKFFDLRIVRYADDETAGPDEVRVQVLAGDAPLADETFRPTYERDEPNGEGCGFVDHEVRQDVPLDPGGSEG